MRPPLRTLTASALLAIAIPAPAQAQTLSSAQQELSAALIDAEGNLTTAEGIAMNFKDWQSRFDSYKAQLDDINNRVDQANAFCQGTFEHDEYVRRKAQCDALYSQLKGLQDQLEPEKANLMAEAEKLQQRAADNKQAMNAIEARLTGGLQHLTFACAMLSAQDFASKCRVPPAPGPRTAPIVEKMNAGVAGSKP